MQEKNRKSTDKKKNKKVKERKWKVSTFPTNQGEVAD